MNPRNADHKVLKIPPDGARTTITSRLRLHKQCSPEGGATCGIGSVQSNHFGWSRLKKFHMLNLAASSSSDTVQGSVLLPHYRTLEVRPGRIS